MKALAAPHCTHQRKGSANYFLVWAVFVIKVVCDSVANPYSIPHHTQPMGHRPVQEVAGCPHPHQFILSHSNTHTLLFLVTFAFPHGVRTETGQAAVGTFTLESVPSTPRPASSHELAQELHAPTPRASWGNGTMFFPGSTPPFLAISCGKAPAAKQGKMSGGPCGACWQRALSKNLPGPGTSVAHGPADGAQAW